jgi:fructokinase
MRNVIGIGEIILDIIFKEDQPCMAVPGGSVFNGMVSLGRMGIPVSFIGETGNDHVGKIIADFMQANGMTTKHITRFSDRKTPVSLAFLNNTKDADYMFYTNPSVSPANTPFPVINQDDILIFGSYYALNPLHRTRITALLDYAKSQKAIIYYDPNFRKAHAHEAKRVRKSVVANYEAADIIRGSDEDFLNLYGKTDMEQIYLEDVRLRCKRLITTHGAQGVNLFTDTVRLHYDVPPIVPVSTIGAGDNFNAGVIYGLIKYNIGYNDLSAIDKVVWVKLIQCGIDFAEEVCLSYLNYISPRSA